MESAHRENAWVRPTDGPLASEESIRVERLRTDVVANEFARLMADVQDLLGSIAHLADPEIGRIRARIEAGITGTRQALADGGLRLQRKAAQAARGGDRYVRDRPWQTAGIAAVLGLIVGVFATRSLLKESNHDQV